LTRLVQEAKDQLTKRHIAIFDATLQKILKMFTVQKVKLEISLQAAFVAAQGISMLHSALNIYSPTSGLHKCARIDSIGLIHHLILEFRVLLQGVGFVDANVAFAHARRCVPSISSTDQSNRSNH
jgi:hypothetical protein